MAGGLLTISVLLALVPANPVEVAIFRQLGRIPEVSDPLWIALPWFGSWLGISVATAVALYAKWIRVGLLCAAAGATTWGVSEGLVRVVGPRPVPPQLRLGPQFEIVFPATNVAVVATLAVVIAPYLGRGVRHVGWMLTVLVAVAEVHLGNHLLWGVVAGGLLGWGVGTLFHLVWGAPGHRVSEEVVRHELELSGFAPVSVVTLKYRLLQPRQFAVATDDGQTFRLKVVRRLHRRAGILYQVGRLLAVLDVQEQPRLSSAHHEVEHEAYVTLLAERAGVRTPPVVLACDVKHAPPLLVHRQVEGERLSEVPVAEIDDTVLEEIWRQLTMLAEAGIAHHDLRVKNILLDAEYRPWLLDFTLSQVGASEQRLDQDLAESLVSLASVAGVERAVDTALRVIPIEQLEAALVNLRPLALPRRILAQPAANRFLLAELRETLADRLQCPIPGFRSPVRPITVVGLLLTGAAVYLLLPELSDMSGVLVALRNANWGWLAAAVIAGELAILMSSVSMLGSSRVRLPFWRTTAVQVAAAFTGRTTPGGAGFFGINLIYIERLGLRRSLAVGITVLNQAGTGAVAFLLGIVGVLATGMSSVPGGLSIPIGWPIGLALVGVLVLLGAVLASPPGRRRIVRPAVEVVGELFETLRHPVRAVQLFGGALGYQVASALGLVASLAALTTDFSVWAVITVFVIGNTLGHLVPSPGGIGAVEAVLVAGLGAVGVAPTAAVTAVLTSRLLTYWLPVLPGIAMFRYLQHREVI